MNNKLHSLEIEHQELSDHALETVVGGRGKYRDRSFGYSYNYTYTGGNSSSNSSFVVTRFGNADFVVSSSNNNNNNTTGQ
jgi:hypothetical protein